MKSNETPTYCPCCGLTKPAWDYAPGKRICSLCLTLDTDTAVFLCRNTMQREIGVKRYTAAGRKQERIAARMQVYAVRGKRCTACHVYKPVDSYNKCAPQGDGLQPICKDCAKLWLVARQAGGQALWHTVRDALRAASPEGK